MTDPPSPVGPAPVDRGVRAMFVVRRSARRQWPTALRTSLSVAAPILIGWLVGNLAAGLLVGLGGLAGLYGGSRPFVNRARLLTVVAVVQAAAVSLGIWAQVVPWLGVAVVTVIAAVATWICNAFKIQPGAYQIALSCAAGAGLHADGADPIRTGALVLIGGLLACVLSLTGAFVDPWGPEREAVATAVEATADYLDEVDRRTQLAADDPELDDYTVLDQAHYRASMSLHQAWVVLVNQQPRWLLSTRGLMRLQEIARNVQLLFAAAVRAPRADPGAAGRVRRLGEQARRRALTWTSSPLTALPLGRPSGLAMLRAGVQPGSRSLLVIIRVAVAATLSGALGTAIGLSHGYWAVAATVLVLSQGFDQRRTVQRGLERTAGTFVGIGLAFFALAAAVNGAVLALLVAAAIWATQLLVQRNYAAASVFITCSAMLMTAAGRSPTGVADLLSARGLDTAVGCAIAIVIFAILSRKDPGAWVESALADVLAAIADAIDELLPARVTGPAGLIARRDLQRRVIWLGENFENSLNGFAAQRAEAERVWPAVAAAQRMAYRTLAEGWRLEAVVAGSASTAYADHPSTQQAPPSHGIRELADAIRHHEPLPRTGELPSFLSRDIGDLRRALS